MTHECFLDDSKDGKQLQSYVCGGFLARSSTWKRFRVDWDSQLRCEGIDYFKSSECHRLEGQFSRFSFDKKIGREIADQIRDRLIAIINSYEGIRGIAVAIPVSVFDQMKRHPSSSVITNLDIYDASFQHVLDQAAKSINEGYIAFAHDDGQDFERLRLVYNAFCNTNPTYRSPRMSGFIPLDDKLHGPLQAADLLSNGVMRNHIGISKGNSPEFQYMWNKSDVLEMDEHSALAMLSHEIRRRGTEVPSDLVQHLPELIDERMRRSHLRG